MHICCSWVRMHGLSAPLVELGTGVDVSSQGTWSGEDGWCPGQLGSGAGMTKGDGGGKGPAVGFCIQPLCQLRVECHALGAGEREQLRGSG